MDMTRKSLKIELNIKLGFDIYGCLKSDNSKYGHLKEKC